MTDDADRRGHGAVLRPAGPDEAAAISALALRSKAHWGYDEAFLAACRDDLTIDPSWCDGVRLVVAEADGTLLGYCRVAGPPPVGELAACSSIPTRSDTAWAAGSSGTPPTWPTASTCTP